MSPATKRKGSKRTEWKIRGAGKGAGQNAYTIVKLQEGRRLGGARVSVNWMGLCSSGTRSFNAHDLREFIQMVDGPGARYSAMWLDMKDSDGNQFWLHLEDGRLAADRRPEALHGTVRWDGLKEAFEEAIEALEEDDGEEE